MSHFFRDLMIQLTMTPSKNFGIDAIIEKVTQWIGTPSSILIHTIFFIGIFALLFFDVSLDHILLILTTAVSLEAIYLALFIQMTVNKANESIEDVEDTIEDVEKDIDDIQAEDKEDEVIEQQMTSTLKNIETQIQKLQKDIEQLQQKRAS